MPSLANAKTIAHLRDVIGRIDGGAVRARQTLPFGIPEIDRRLPYGGLAYGAVHEIGGGGEDAVWGAASAVFVAGIAARTTGVVLWCLSRPDLFAPSLANVGLGPERVIFVECQSDAGVQEAAEEALRFGGLGAVVGEMCRFPMDVSRRLQLAAEQKGMMCLVIRRWRRQTEVTDFGNPTAAITRWRISRRPSTELPVQGVGRPRWLLELMRQRAGEVFDIEVEACDGDGRMRAPVDPASELSRRYG